MKDGRERRKDENGRHREGEERKGKERGWVPTFFSKFPPMVYSTLIINRIIRAE